LTKLKAVNNISIDLPSLKTLHLNHISLKNKDNFNKLLNECPILEDLETRDIYYIEKQCKGVRLKTLPKLMRANIDASDVPIKAIHNVNFLKLKGKVLILISILLIYPKSLVVYVIIIIKRGQLGLRQ
jgi:hypothetical protein